MNASDPRVSRRAVLLGAAGAAFIAACGGDDDGSAAGTSTSTSAAAAGPVLLKFFGDDYLIPEREQRLTFGLGDQDGVALIDVPPSLEFRIIDQSGEAIGDPVTVESRMGDLLPRPYFAVPVTVPDEGFYTAETEVDGQPLSRDFGVVSADASRVLQVGDRMPDIETPTTADNQGVDPICTREPPCPLHAVTLRQALADGAPTALLISTPEFCQVAICGPVLEVLLAQQDAFSSIRMIHAEVFTDETTQVTTEAVRSFGLTFEPALFVADATGAITTRLDNIFDETELTAALEQVALV